MKDGMDIPALMAEIGTAARAAAAELACATAEQKHAALIGAAEAVWARRAEIIAANAEDLAYGRDKGLSAAMMDRLTLTEDRIRGIVDGSARGRRAEGPGGRGHRGMGYAVGASYSPRADAAGRHRRDL